MPRLIRLLLCVFNRRAMFCYMLKNTYSDKTQRGERSAVDSECGFKRSKPEWKLQSEENYELQKQSRK